MPSAYTTPILEGSDTLDAYLWRIARGFGACLEQRDEPLSSPTILRYEVSPDYEDGLRKAERALERWRALSDDERRAEYDTHVARRRRELHAERTDRAQTTRSRYLAMREQVEAWEPPTPDHEGLKEMALRQIDESLEWDAHTPRPLTIPPFDEWVSQRAGHLLDDVKTAADYLADARDRIASRNAWLAALNDSVPCPNPAPDDGGNQ